MITESGDADIADGGLELDERMSLVVWVRWDGFTAGTEVGIVANSTLVSVSLNVGLGTIGVVAKRTITVDTVVTSLGGI
jgi:hypothetical protein